MWTMRKLFSQLAEAEKDYELHVQYTEKNNGKFCTGFDVVSDKVDFIDVFSRGKIIRLGSINGN
jgi:hypothetical protein